MKAFELMALLAKIQCDAEVLLTTAEYDLEIQGVDEAVRDYITLNVAVKEMEVEQST